MSSKALNKVVLPHSKGNKFKFNTAGADYKYPTFLDPGELLFVLYDPFLIFLGEKFTLFLSHLYL
jgi:hypothetical protein